MFDYRTGPATLPHRATTTDSLRTQNESKSGTFAMNSKLWRVASIGAAFALTKINYPVAIAFSAISLAAFAGSALHSRFCKREEPTLHCQEKMMLTEGKGADINSDTGLITKKVKMHEAIQKVIKEKRVRSEKKSYAEYQAANHQLKSDYQRDCVDIKMKNPECPGPALDIRLGRYKKERQKISDIHVIKMQSLSILYHERKEREELRYKDQFDLTFARYNSETYHLRDEIGSRFVASGSEYKKLRNDIEMKYYDEKATYELHDYAVAMREVFQGEEEQVEIEHLPMIFDQVKDKPITSRFAEENQDQEKSQAKSPAPAVDKSMDLHLEDEMAGFQFKEEDKFFQSKPDVRLVGDIDDYEYDGELDFKEQAAKDLAEMLEKSAPRKTDSTDGLEDEVDQVLANYAKSSYTDHEYEEYLRMEDARIAEFDRDVEETDARLASRYGVN